MAQTPATFRQDGESLDYTPSSAVTAGDVIVLAGRVYVAKHDIPANIKGSLACVGVFRFPKDASTFTEGEPAYWNPTGDPVGGTAGSGAMSDSASSGATFAGMVIPGGGVATGVATVEVLLAIQAGSGGESAGASATVAATGTVQADAAQLGQGFTLVTAADAAKGVKLPAAVAGRVVRIKNNENAVLKVWPATGDAINAAAVNANVTMAALTSWTLTAYDATTWYTTPLVAS